jgi:1,5-anhydro-D-fructose reductase (1,5-anhydro-D-mannitol-forming)
VKSKINWGIVGCGWVARDYVAPAILSAPSADLLALCDVNPKATARIREFAPGAQAFVELDEFLAWPELDAVYIATPNHLHLPLCVAAARAGKHVLCEKPMATTLADAQQMVDACAGHGVVYATAFDQRFHAAHQLLREKIKAGELGDITTVRIHYACWTPTDWRPASDDGAHENWRVDPQKAGGGAFIDLAPHGLDLAQMLLDEELVEVACLLQRRVFDYPVDDGAVLIGRFASGALLTHNVAYNCPDAFPRRTLEVVGTKAMARLHNTLGQTPGGTFELVSAQTGEVARVELDAKLDVSPFQNGVEAYSRCLLEGRPFPFFPARDLHTMTIIEAAARGAGGIHIEPNERIAP